MKRAIIFLSLLLFWQNDLSADDFYVDARQGSNGTGNGSKEKPWLTISFALSKITGTGHAIHVAPGIYDTVMDGAFPEIFPLLIRSGISLIGAGADSTIVDAKASSTVMRFENTGSAQIRIEGFTIRGGKNSAGGGVILQNSNALVQHNVFDRNEQIFGGSGGGAITIEGGSITVAQNSFTNNKAGGSGGAITVGSGTVFIRQNQFIGNSAGFSGAAFYMRTGANVGVEIVENVFRANVAGFDNEDIYIGSFLSQSSLSPLVSRNIITSGIKCENAKPRIMNNTLAGTGSKTAIRLQNAAPAISNNIIAGWGNGILETNATSDPDTVAYNLFFNNTCLYYDENIRCLNTLTTLEALTAEAAHNLAGDPKFVNAANNDYRLQPGSPAIDAGDPNSPKDPDNTRADIGALYFSPPPNQSPVVANTIAAQTLTVGGTSFIRNLNTAPAVFTDPDGDALTYTASSSAVNIASASISGSTLTVAPVAAGNAMITVTASDGRDGTAPTTFAATVNLPFTDVNAMLAGVKRGSVAWGDYDNDDDLDILLIGDSQNTNDPTKFIAKVYRNERGAFVDTNAPLTRVTYGAAAWGDYDNDGDLDILLTGSTSAFEGGAITVLYKNDNGNFVDAGINLAEAYFSAVAWGDYDNDGDLDILLTGRRFSQATIARIYRNDAGIFQNIQANLVGVENSSAAWGDYDNDGDLDILLAGRNRDQSQSSTSIIAKVYRNDNGAFVDINAPLPQVFRCSAAWGDYDSDGDLDILITGITESNGLIAQIYRNDNNAFVLTPIVLAAVHKSSAKFGDYDNDGDLDILLTGDASTQTSNPAHTTKIYRNDNGNFSDIAVSIPGVSESSVEWGDFDNDGDLDILLTGARNADPLGLVLRNNSSQANTVPAAPGGLAATVNGNSVTLNWSKSSDNQTAANALTYNLRVGKTAGGSEIVAPMADAGTGYRRVPLLGNTNHRNNWTIKNLPDGTYFWSVQAIDQAFAGSAFAQERSFTIGTVANRPPVVANVIANATIAVGDTAFTRDLNAAPVVFNDPDGDTLKYSASSSATNIATANIAGSTLTVAALAAGSATITITANDGHGRTAQTGFEVTVIASPTLTNLNPTSGNRLQTLNVVFTGTNFNSSIAVNVGAGITVNSTTVTSSTQLTANITITAAAATGPRNFSAGNSNSQTFTVNNPAPTLTSINPTTGSVGQTLDMTFTGANFLSNATTVNLGSGITVNSITVTSPTNLTANITITAAAVTGARNVSVVNSSPGGGTSINQTFTVQPQTVTLTNLSPNTGNRLQTLNVFFTGTNFNSSLAVNVGAGITINSTTVNSSTQLTANITISATAATGPRNFSVGNSNGQNFTVNNPAPTLASIAPSTGNVGQTLNVVFTGTNFLNDATTVNFGGGITVNSITVTSTTNLAANITITAAAVTGARNVSVTNSAPGGGASATQMFTVRVNQAPVIALIPVSAQPENQPFAIQADITDDAGVIVNPQIKYRRGGESDFAAVAMAPLVSDRYQGMIPSGVANERGVEYFIEAADRDGATTRLPPAPNIFSIRVLISNSAKPTAQPGGVTENLYRLVSVPLDVNDPTALAVLQDDLGMYDQAVWRLFDLVADRPLTEKRPYIEISEIGVFKPGKSFFLIVTAPGKIIDSGPGRTVTTEQEFAVTLEIGHNFIATPFNFTIPANKLRLQNSGPLRLRTYDGSDWKEVNELTPWEGYYVDNNNASRNLLLINPNLFASAALPMAREENVRAAHENMWRVKISASCGRARDTENFAGVAPASNDDYDFNDLAEPPPIGDFVSLYFPHPEWQKALSRFSDDMRAPANSNQQWRFVVESNVPNEIVNLRFGGWREIDPALAVVLVDEAMNYKQNLRENAVYQYQPRQRESTKSFTLIVGKAEFVAGQTASVQGVPENFVLEQNFPNPFSSGGNFGAKETAIRFGLPATSVVTIKIFDLAGHEVATLLDRAELPAGRHQRLWNGRDAQGRALTSGIYFCRLAVGSFVKTIKLMLMR